MRIYHKTIRDGIIDQIYHDVVDSEVKESIFVVDIGRTVGNPPDIVMLDDTAGTGRYVIIGIAGEYLDLMNVRQEDLYFETGVLGLSISEKSCGTCIDSADIWFNGCLIDEHDIEGVMMDLDIRGIQYKVVSVLNKIT